MMVKFRAVLAMALSALMAGEALAGAPKSAAPKPGDVPPDVSAATWLNTPSDVKKVSLKAFEGKVVVVEFWATWCPPCRDSVPHLVKLHNDLKDKGLVILGLTQEPKDKIEKFVADNTMSYIVGAGSKTSAQYGVRGIPNATVIGRAGRVVWTGHPMDPGFEKAIKEELDKDAN